MATHKKVQVVYGLEDVPFRWTKDKLEATLRVGFEKRSETAMACIARVEPDSGDIDGKWNVWMSLPECHGTDTLIRVAQRLEAITEGKVTDGEEIG